MFGVKAWLCVGLSYFLVLGVEMATRSMVIRSVMVRVAQLEEQLRWLQDCGQKNAEKFNEQLSLVEEGYRSPPRKMRH